MSDHMKARHPKYADALDHIIEALQLIRSKNPDATLNQAITFLAIAREMNITQKELLGDILHMKTSGQSRIISLLSQHGDRNVEGWDIIRAYENPMDRREKLLRLTQKGELLLSAFMSHMSRMCKAVTKPETV